MAETSHRRRLIWFCQTETVARQPDVLRRLRDQIGLTTIMPESPVCHTSGFAASGELAAAGPFEDWRSRLDRWPRGRQGVYPPVAGIVSGFDDAPLRALLEHCALLGIEVWGHLGLWSYGGDVYPEYAMQDLDGRPLSTQHAAWGVGLCPSRYRLNDWVQAGLLEAIGRYGLTAFCVDHARYPGPANLAALLGCGCASCQEAAGALGFDFHSLRRRLRAWLDRARHASPERLRALVDGRASPLDLLAWLGEDAVVLEWLECRAALLAAPMARFRTAVQAAAGPGALFGSDVFAPSIALLGGQRYSTWEQHADFLTGGSSYGGVVGWATAIPSVASTWAPALAATIGGLHQSEALALVYRAFGVDDLGLPEHLPATDAAHLPLPELFEREVQRLVAAASGRVPLYPPVTAHGDPALVTHLCQAVAAAGCDGAMLGLDPDQPEALKAVARYLGV